jgi:hypothetical protein
MDSAVMDSVAAAVAVAVAVAGGRSRKW